MVDYFGMDSSQMPLDVLLCRRLLKDFESKFYLNRSRPLYFDKELKDTANLVLDGMLTLDEKLKLVIPIAFQVLGVFPKRLAHKHILRIRSCGRVFSAPTHNLKSNGYIKYLNEKIRTNSRHGG